MADKNAREEILIATTKAQRSLKTLEWLQRALELDAPPERIEAFDISNLGDSGIVAGMTVFQHGRPRKSDYRKFRIRTTDGQNDYGAMHEALTRRFQHYLDGDPGFCPLPDLLLIDGGAEHAAVAQAVLDGFGLSVPVFGMVKDDRKSGGLFLHRHDPGGDAPVFHRLSAPAAAREPCVRTRSDPRRGREAAQRAAARIPQRQGHPRSLV